MPTYTSVGIYITSATTLVQRIERCDAIIDLLEAKLIDAAGQENIQEYTLDDGQTKISTVYRSIEGIESAITAITRRREKYVNEYNGRVVTLVDRKNLKRN